jgi:hypothetical protein
MLYLQSFGHQARDLPAQKNTHLQRLPGKNGLTGVTGSIVQVQKIKP